MTDTVFATLESLHSRLERLERQAHLGMFHSASVSNRITEEDILNAIGRYKNENIARGFIFEVRNFGSENNWMVRCKRGTIGTQFELTYIRHGSPRGYFTVQGSRYETLDQAGECIWKLAVQMLG